jgi:hypothetical protein
MLHLPGSISFSVDIGYFLKLQGPLHGNREVIEPSKKEEVIISGILAGDLLDLFRMLQNFPDLVRNIL